jgi:calcium-dependent protein kinase
MKIIDFGAGVCNFSDSHMKCPEVIGTPWYMAPETIKKEFSHRSDIWSVGVLTYQMLCGKMPFDDPLGLYRQYAIFKSIMDDTPSLEDNGMKYISEEAKDFIIQCLNKNYIERPSAEDALNHAWLHYNDASSGRVLCTIPLQNAHINEEISFFI